MEAGLLPSLVGYYKAVAHTAQVGHAYECARLEKTITELQQQLDTQTALTNEEEERVQHAQADLQTAQQSILAQEKRVVALQHEIDALRQAHEATQGQDQQAVKQARATADSFKREIKALKEDLKLRDEEVRDLRQDAADRAVEEKEARDLARERDRSSREHREQVRAKDIEIRKLGHILEQTSARVAGLEADVGESREALKLTTMLLREAEARLREQALQGVAGRRSSQVTAALAAAAATQQTLAQPAVKQKAPAASIAVPKAVKKPVIADAESEEEQEPEQAPSETSTPAVQRPRKRAAAPTTLQEPPTTDYDAVPVAIAAQKQKQLAARRALAADKENYEPRARKSAVAAAGAKRKGKVMMSVEEFVASPPRSSSGEDSPAIKETAKVVKKRGGAKAMTSAALAKAAAAGKTKKSDFSMTPFVDKTRKLSVIPLSPPTSRDQQIRLRDEEDAGAQGGKMKKKRKLLGAGQRTLMDDTPKKTIVGGKKVFDFGKDLSPLKRPKSSGLVLK
ncbi:hypothetical protein BCR37DRAFT_391025 [Protomyces lactucae-debilis]|uniref:Uncharacterized protein n=1 Tax=Protomyces lactucae-debilis TaxID=2754530 RepID=A0A1Y2FQG9_PROLT|nr:uncharacterized protein BCR37DRAFT_391025 [Protomyces lactucae-debilis]ORY86228.1 hypothetical protein BCR37DRAFT_391025 [Protomyces lactucae-debilis]